MAVPIQFLVVGAVVLAVLVGYWLSHLDEKRRGREMRALAARMGCTYEADDWAVRPVRFLGFRPFGQGQRRHARHVLAGTHEGRRFEAFQYQYDVKQGKSSHTYVHRVLVLPMPVASPGLSVEPEGVGHKIRDAFGGEDIDFESDEFSRKWWVKAPDRKFAYDVLHPGAMEFFLRAPGGLWQWKGEALLVSWPGKLEPRHVQGMLDQGAGFARLLPRHLLAAARPPG